METPWVPRQHENKAIDRIYDTRHKGTVCGQETRHIGQSGNNYNDTRHRDTLSTGDTKYSLAIS